MRSSSPPTGCRARRTSRDPEVRRSRGRPTFDLFGAPPALGGGRRPPPRASRRWPSAGPQREGRPGSFGRLQGRPEEPDLVGVLDPSGELAFPAPARLRRPGDDDPDPEPPATDRRAEGGDPVAIALEAIAAEAGERRSGLVRGDQGLVEREAEPAPDVSPARDQASRASEGGTSPPPQHPARTRCIEQGGEDEDARRDPERGDLGTPPERPPAGEGSEAEGRRVTSTKRSAKVRDVSSTKVRKGVMVGSPLGDPPILAAIVGPPAPS